jgi:hypothetical protein
MVKGVGQNRWSVFARLLGCLLVHLDQIKKQHHRSNDVFIPSWFFFILFSFSVTGRRVSAGPIFSRID